MLVKAVCVPLESKKVPSSECPITYILPSLSSTEATFFGFDLLNGCFSASTVHKNVITGNELYQFKKLLGINFDSIENVSFSKNERQLVLQIIIKYFELHLDGFRKPKSLQILEAVFN